MRAALVAIFVFAALLSAGHYVGAPFYCRGGIAIPTLDAKALCGADFHLNRSGSVLLYFASVAAAVFFGVIAALFSGRKPAATADKQTSKAVETFEEIVAAEEKKLQKPEVTPPVAHPSALQAALPVAAVTAAAASPVATPTPTAPPPTVTAVENKATEEIKAALAVIPPAQSNSEVVPAKAPEVKLEPGPQPAPTPVKAEEDPLTAAIGDAITVGLAAKSIGAKGSFDGTNEELLQIFRELKKHEGVNAIAQAQRLLDESTLAALSKGIDPKQHLSQIAHLVLGEDPELKSGVVRGVVVHVAARLKELGVARQNIPGATKGAASVS